MGVDRSVGRNLSVPVKERIAIGGGVPSVEGVAVLGRSSWVSGLRILLDSSAVIESGRSVAVNIVNSERRRSPLRVEHQVGRRHGREGVRSGETRVGIPARERVVGVDTALSSSGSPLVGVAGDGSVELYVLDGLEVRAAVVVVDVVGVSIVVEVIRSNVLFIVAVIEGVAANHLGCQAIAIRVVCLAVRLGSGISVVISVLEIVVDRKGVGTSPVGVPVLCCSAAGQQIRVHDELLGNVTSALVFDFLPAHERVVVAFCGGPQSRDILSKLCIEAVGARSRCAVGSDDVIINPALMVSVEGHRVLGQLVVHIQDRATVGCDNNTGVCVLGGVLLPALSGNGRRIACLDRRSDRSGCIPGVVVFERGCLARIVVLLEQIHDGVVYGVTLPLGVEGGVAVDGYRGARGLG